MLLDLVEFGWSVAFIQKQRFVGVDSQHLGLQVWDYWALRVAVFDCAFGLRETEPFCEETAFVACVGRVQVLG